MDDKMSDKGMLSEERIEALLDGVLNNAAGYDDIDPDDIRSAIRQAVAEAGEAIADELEHGFSDDDGHHKQYAAAIRRRVGR